MRSSYPVRNFYQVILQNVAKKPQQTIIFEEKLKISNLELKLYIDSIASFLVEVGIKPGDKVALLMSNSWQFIANLFAISKIGAVIVPVNNFLKQDEIAYILNDSQAKLLFCSAKYVAETRNMIVKSNINHIVWVDGLPLKNEQHIDFNQIIANLRNDANYVDADINRLAAILYTSGTTGKPKGAMLAFRNIFSNIYGAMEYYQIKEGKGSLLCYLPMFHAFTFTVTILFPIVSNSSVIVIRSISSKKDFKNLLKQLLLHRCQLFAGIPDIYSALVKSKLPWYFHWFHSVQCFISSAAPPAEETSRRFSQDFKRGKLVQGYGLTECSPGVSLGKAEDNKPGSVGRPLPGYTVCAFDEEMQPVPSGAIGEICVQGDCVMLGYFNRPQDTAEAIVNGWLKTGDLGYIDHDGFLFIVDRKKDLIINKGMNIYPREIEEHLYTHHKVNACAVIGIKDSEANEMPVAYIELKPELSASEQEFKEFLKPLLATFKQPRKFYFVASLPRNATGKILKRELRELV